MADRSGCAYLVCGAEGQLGRAFLRLWGSQAVGLSRSQLDIADAAAVDRVTAEYRPRTIVNCAAYTAVDRAEDEPEAARRVNVVGVENLAQASGAARLVHFSTDYVFGGDAERRSPLAESDSPSPQSVYARTKLAGESAAAAAKNHLVIRTCGLYGRLDAARGGNFVETMLRLGRERGRVRVVDDQHCTPSYVDDVAAAADWLIDHEAQGLYHITSAGATTWYEFAMAIFEEAGLAVAVEPITTAQYGAKAPRPAYSVLACDKYLRAGGPPLRPWREALAAYLRDRAAA